MDLCSKIIHIFWNCQICLNNKRISSLYAMKRCSAGECTNECGARFLSCLGLSVQQMCTFMWSWSRNYLILFYWSDWYFFRCDRKTIWSHFLAQIMIVSKSKELWLSNAFAEHSMSCQKWYFSVRDWPISMEQGPVLMSAVLDSGKKLRKAAKHPQEVYIVVISLFQLKMINMFSI